MTTDEHLSFVLESINERMHPGRTCPGAESLGECAAISTLHGHSGSEFYVASLYLWPAAMDLQSATVAAWFTAAFCESVVVSAILHDPDNDTIDGVTDGGRCWPWEVTFTLQGPHDTNGLKGRALPPMPWAADPVPDDSIPLAQSRTGAAALAAVPDWDNRQTRDLAGWINELRTLADHPKSMDGWLRSAMRTIADGLSAHATDGVRAGLAHRASELHEKAGMPLDQARELALSEAGIASAADNQWFGDMMILQVLADSDCVNEQEREALTRWMAASQPPGVVPTEAPGLSFRRLRDALVDCEVVHYEAVHDAEGYDGGVTLGRIEAAHKALTTGVRGACKTSDGGM